MSCFCLKAFRSMLWAVLLLVGETAGYGLNGNYIPPQTTPTWSWPTLPSFYPTPPPTSPTQPPQTVPTQPVTLPPLTFPPMTFPPLTFPPTIPVTFPPITTKTTQPPIPTSTGIPIVIYPTYGYDYTQSYYPGNFM